IFTSLEFSRVLFRSIDGYINQIKNITEVYNVQKLIEGSTKYAILKETNIIEIKLEDNLDLSNLQSLANTQGYVVTENDPMKVNDSQELVYYLIDESAKKSTIEMAKILSQNIKYQHISPKYISIR